MSTEASLRLKHNKNLKLAAGKTKNSKRGRKSYSSVDADQPANLDRKRKRKYADQNLDGEVTYNVKAKKNKALSKKGQNQGRAGSVKAKKSDEPSRTIWVSRVTKAATSKTKHPSTKVKDKVERVEESSGKWGAKVKKVDSKYGVLKKPTGSKIDSSNHSQKKYLDASAATSEKRTGPNRKASVNDDSEVLEDQPKKRKRTIRLDPYDISNKRLDDGIVTDGHTKVEKKEPQKDAEMSKNAQFKAIKPSPSILKFVEDNLLGRRHLIELKRAGYNVDLSAPLDNIPFSKSSERERIEENVFRSKLEFFAAAKISSSFPPPDLPEIAFAGRSNVGKSSLLNSLTRQWGVARTSDKPGLTQTINFFQLGSKLCLVDLPGYGFAYAKEEVKDAWEELVKEYVSTRVGLKQVCLLVDTKWGIKPRDYELINLMERSRTKYQIVLTKTDLVFPIDVARRAMQIEENLKANKSIVQPVMMVSSKTGAGIGSLRTVLSKIARFARL